LTIQLDRRAMTNPPFRTEVLKLRRWCGDPLEALAAAGEPEARRSAVVVDAVVADLGPIRSRASLLSSFAREASPSEPVRTAYAIRWIELGSGIAASNVSRSRRRRVVGPLLRARP
jgi:hypothetical protein